ncbi:MAG TPA: hypothetical protein VM142_09985 [Acidimicrobiales bacterium]|nr:hypothetical protein [Acidimicrobiales bacterium]
MPQRRHDESGFAMVVVLVVMTVSLLLVSVLLSQGEHLDRSTFRDRKWHTALQVAEAGVQRTIVELKTDFEFGGITTATHVPGGDFQTKVQQDSAFGPGNRTITSTAYVPSLGHRNEVRRRVKVTIGPPPSLLYALFSETCLVVENNGDPVKGDVFANLDITLSNNTVVQGKIESSRGVVDMVNGSKVQRNGTKGGSILSGGKPNTACGKTGVWGVNMDNGSSVERDVTVRRECPAIGSPSPPLEFGIKGASGMGGATINGNAVAWGSVGPNVAGFTTTHPAPGSCSPRPVSTTSAPPYKAKDAPDIKAFYEKAFAGTGVSVTTHSSGSAFNSSAPTSISGVHIIALGSDASQTVNLNGKTITGTFILVTPTEILRDNSGGGFFYDGPSFSGANGIVQLISLRPAGSSGITFTDNQFKIKNQPCMLFYSTGAVSMKNDAIIYGAVYGSSVDLKNGFKVVYDKCVERSLGFGDAMAVPHVFREVNPAGSA